MSRYISAVLGVIFLCFAAAILFGGYRVAWWTPGLLCLIVAGDNIFDALSGDSHHE